MYLILECKHFKFCRTATGPICRRSDSASFNSQRIAMYL